VIRAVETISSSQHQDCVVKQNAWCTLNRIFGAIKWVEDERNRVG